MNNKLNVDFTKLGHNLEVNLTSKMLPHIWCSGCPLGSNLQAVLRGAKKAGYELVDEGNGKQNMVLISGIGCTGRASGYLEIDGFHTTHGRAIPFAAGVKYSMQDRAEVVVFSGDGDLFAIGGNHFIHAARRGDDITVICNNNGTYGLTGGQASATSFEDMITPTTPKGRSNAHPFDLVNLALGAGAAFVARITSAHYSKLPGIMAEAMKTDGFAFIDLVSGCPVVAGKRNGYPTGVYLRENLLEASVEVDTSDPKNLLSEATQIHFDHTKGYTRIPIGIFRRQK